MNGEVSLLRPAAGNPATRPDLTDALRASVTVKRAQVIELLKKAVSEFGNQITFANSMGAEDMVLTDIILREQLPIDIFTLDTGRLPVETYDLMAEVEQIYDTRLKIFFPRSDTVEN